MDQAEILRRWVKRKEQGFDVDMLTALQEKQSGSTTTIGVVGLHNEAMQNCNLLANIAVVLAKQRKEIMIVDSQKGKIDTSIPLGLFPKYALEDLLAKRSGKDDCVYKAASQVKFIKANDTLLHLDKLDVNMRNTFFREWALFEEQSDMIFVNDMHLSPILNFSDLLVITSDDSDAITAVYDLVRKFVRNAFQETRISLVVNMCTTESKGKTVAKKFIATAQKFLNLAVNDLGVVVLEPEIIRAFKNRTAFVSKYPYLRATHNVNNIACNLLQVTETKIETR